MHLYKMVTAPRGTCKLLLSIAKGSCRGQLGHLILNWLSKHQYVSNWLRFSFIIFGHICISLAVTQKGALGFVLEIL